MISTGSRFACRIIRVVTRIVPMHIMRLSKDSFITFITSITYLFDINSNKIDETKVSEQVVTLKQFKSHTLKIWFSIL